MAGLALALSACAPALAKTKILPDGAPTPMPRQDFPALPALPSLNWADLPVKLTIQDIVTYNDNVFALPKGVNPTQGLRRGDFYNLTLLGASSRFYMGQQKLSLNGAFGWTRYLNDTVANASQYNLNGALDWRFTSRCTGTLTGTISKLPSLAEEQIGSGINEVRLQSFKQTATCLVWGGFSLVANSGISSTRNSTGINRLVDNDSKYVAGGIAYEWSALDSSQLLYRHSDSLYPNRGAGTPPNALNLAREIIQDDVTASYSRTFSPRLDATVSAGLSRFTLIPAGGGAANIAPHYALTANWRPSEKIALRASIARSVGQPTQSRAEDATSPLPDVTTSILSNVQISNVASLSGSYLWSPKTSVNAVVSIGKATGAFVNNGQGLALAAETKTLTASLGVSYLVTPFITSSLNYQFSDRRAPGFETVVNRVTLGMNYAPY